MRVGCEQRLACMPGRKLTARRYGSISAIGNRVTNVTCERSVGTRQRQKGKKCSKNLSRCRSRDIENGFDREDVSWSGMERFAREHRFGSNNRALNAAAQAARQRPQPVGADQRPAQEFVNSCFGERVPADIDREKRRAEMGCRGAT